MPTLAHGCGRLMGVGIPMVLRQYATHDRLGRALSDVRISVIDRCNHRCPYCMPAEAYPETFSFASASERLSFEEIERLARAFVALGAYKLRLTGGEPLLRRGLPQLVRHLAAIPGLRDLAMTTNGVLLPRHAQSLREAGLHRLTVSLDSLDPANFLSLSGGRGSVQEVLAGIAAAEAAGFASIKINCVVVRGINDGDIFDLVEHFRGTGHILRFIEYMDVGTLNQWQASQVVPSAELRARIQVRWPLRALDPIRRGEVATRHAFIDGAGEIGFISSVSEPFCADCSRMRLAADGELFTCLFASSGYDLRGLLRGGISDAELRARIAHLWLRRNDRYSEVRAEERAGGASKHVEMYHIGG